MTKKTDFANPEYLSLTGLTRFCDLSKSTLNRLKAKCEDFPRPIKISQTYLYRVEDVRKWLDSYQDKPETTAAE